MKRILVAVNFSEEAEHLITYTEELARNMKAEVVLMHTEPFTDAYAITATPAVSYAMAGSAIPDEYTHDERMHDAEDKLEQFKTRLAKKGISTTSILLDESLNRAVADSVQDVHADLLIIGSHKHGALYHLLFGNTSEQIINKIDIPVLVVPE